MEQIEFRTEIIDNENGFTMIITLMILLLLTVLGVAAMNTSVLETMISSADLKKRIAFNAAEAGIDHASGVLKNQFFTQNQLSIGSALASGSLPKVTWTFALSGSTASTNCTDPQQWVACFNKGAHYLNNVSIGNSTNYTVSLRNNNDGGGPATDMDGTIYLSSLAVVGAGNTATRAAIEIGMNGYISNISSIAAYTAQMAAGAGKSSNALDLTAVSSTNLGQLSSMIDQNSKKVY